MKTLKVFAIFLCFSACAASAQVMASHAPTFKAPEAPGATVPLRAVGRTVARVNGVELTDLDLVRETYTIFPYAKQHNGVPKEMEGDIRQGALNMIIFEELVYQEAKRRQVTIPSEKVDRAAAQLRNLFSSQKEYQQFVQQEFHGSQKLVRTKVERSLLIDKLLKQEVESKTIVTLADEREFYTKHQERFQIPESFEFQSISILPPNNANSTQLKDAQRRAQEALKKAKATGSYEQFGVLAERISEDDFRVMMGDHKIAERSKLPPAVANALAAMQPGQVSDLIEFDKNAYTILRLTSHVPAGLQKFDDIKAPLLSKMKKDKAEQLRSSFSAKLKKNAKIEILKAS